MKQKHLIALLALAGAAAAFVWWKNSSAPGTATGDIDGTDVSGDTAFVNGVNTNSTATLPAAAAAALAAAAASNPPVNSGGTDTANTTDTTPAATAPALPATAAAPPAAATGLQWGLLSTFSNAYQTWLARGKKKDRPNTEKNLARFERRYERKHKVQVGSATTLGTGVSGGPP